MGPLYVRSTAWRRIIASLIRAGICGHCTATIDLQDVLGHRAQVEAFQRKHRIALLTLMFTGTVGPTRIKQTLGDADGFARIKAHHTAVLETLKLFPEGEEIRIPAV